MEDSQHIEKDDIQLYVPKWKIENVPEAILAEPIEANQQQQDQQQKIMEELENFIFFRQGPPKRMTEDVGKLNNIERRLRISYRRPVNEVSDEKKRELDLLQFERCKRLIMERHMITLPIELSTDVRCLMKCDEANLCGLGLVIKLYNSQSKLLLASKRRVGRTTTYIISSSEKNITETDNKYQGKISSNFLRKEWLAYDEGFSPQKVRELSDCRKQLAYVRYGNDLRSAGNRHFEVTVPAVDSNMCPYEFRPMEDTNELAQHLRIDSNKVLQLKTYKDGNDKLIQDRKDFKLCLSSTVCLWSRRVSKDEYEIGIRHPLSIIQGFAVCLSNLDAKMFFD